jgi:hypothetical protein
MTFETAEDVLEHFGVKGMKWGVRKKRPKPTAAQRRARQQRRDKIVTGVLLTVAAAAYASSILEAVGSTRARDVPPYSNPFGSGYSRPRSRPASPADIINQERETKLASIRGHYTQGFIDADQLRNFEASLNTRYDRKVAEAGG